MTIAYADEREVGSVAVYLCSAAGYAPSGGDAARTCLADGSWGGAAPTACVVRRRQPLSVMLRD